MSSERVIFFVKYLSIYSFFIKQKLTQIILLSLWFLLVYIITQSRQTQFLISILSVHFTSFSIPTLKNYLVFDERNLARRKKLKSQAHTLGDLNIVLQILQKMNDFWFITNQIWKQIFVSSQLHTFDSYQKSWALIYKNGR